MTVSDAGTCPGLFAPSFRDKHLPGAEWANVPGSPVTPGIMPGWDVRTGAKAFA